MEKLSSGKFFRKDYSGQDLRNADLSNSEFTCCKFDDADLSGANCSGSKFIAGSMMRTRCTNTNFTNADLATRFFPSDCYGMTLTLRCQTFKGCSISKMWWFGWLYFALLMEPEKEDGKDLREVLISLLGPSRYARIKTMFEGRAI